MNKENMFKLLKISTLTLMASIAFVGVGCKGGKGSKATRASDPAKAPTEEESTRTLITKDGQALTVTQKQKFNTDSGEEESHTIEFIYDLQTKCMDPTKKMCSLISETIGTVFKKGKAMIHFNTDKGDGYILKKGSDLEIKLPGARLSGSNTSTVTKTLEISGNSEIFFDN